MKFNLDLHKDNAHDAKMKTDGISIGFSTGAVAVKSLADEKLLRALKKIGMVTNTNSIFTGEVNQIAKEIIREWESLFKEKA